MRSLLSCEYFTITFQLYIWWLVMPPVSANRNLVVKEHKNSKFCPQQETGDNDIAIKQVTWTPNEADMYDNNI